MLRIPKRSLDCPAEAKTLAQYRTEFRPTLRRHLTQTIMSLNGRGSLFGEIFPLNRTATLFVSSTKMSIDRTWPRPELSGAWWAGMRNAGFRRRHSETLVFVSLVSLTI